MDHLVAFHILVRMTDRTQKVYGWGSTLNVYGALGDEQHEIRATIAASHVYNLPQIGAI